MKLLLHICCAPCSAACIKVLREENIDIVGYWYNPNIHPFKEYDNRLKALKNSPSKGVLGTFLPEVTITANKRKGGSVNYLSHFNISKAKDGEKIDWKEKFRDNPDGPKEIEKLALFF